MKKLITLFLLIPVMSMAQTKDGYSKKSIKTDTVYNIPDSVFVKVLELKVNEFIKLLGTIPHDTYLTLDPRTTMKEFLGWVRGFPKK